MDTMPLTYLCQWHIICKVEIGFVETERFTKKFALVASDFELQKLQSELRVNPEKGAVIPGAGGARKVRMAIGHGGKSSGARVIYYVQVTRYEVMFLDIYAKREKGNLSPQERKVIAKFILGLKGNANEEAKRKA